MPSISEVHRQLLPIVQPLLDWYQHNARVLPWRQNTDPYRVWISEIMLQQTRVEAVIPYYERFLKRLPTLQSLAEVPEEELLKLWEGLGYYSRVRNLQKAAQIICREWNGVFPSEYEQLLKLPGIGVYTAGAVSSIAFGKPVPAVDGNVLRVISRLIGSRDDIADPAVKTRFTAALTALYPEGHCGDFTQSLMELGAVVCVPNGSPHCDLCPLSGLCAACRHGTQAEIPVKAPKAARRQDEKTVFLLRCEDRIAVQKREPGGLLGGLWEFPCTDGALTPQSAQEWLNAHKITADVLRPLPDKKHIFTHIQWNMHCFAARCRTSGSDFIWVTENALDETITLPSAFAKFRKFLDLIPE